MTCATSDTPAKVSIHVVVAAERSLLPGIQHSSRFESPLFVCISRNSFRARPYFSAIEIANRRDLQYSESSFNFSTISGSELEIVEIAWLEDQAVTVAIPLNLMQSDLLLLAQDWCRSVPSKGSF